MSHATCKYVFLLMFSVAGMLGSAQNNHMLQTQAEQAMLVKDWYAATQYYNRLYQRDSLRTKLTYQFAEASRLNFSVDQALRLYKKVAAVEVERYPLSCYWIGQLLKNKMEYKEAGKWFLKFSKLKLKENPSYYKTKAKLEVEACELAQIMVKNQSGQSLQKLDTLINTKQSEYAAVENNHQLYFSSVKLPSSIPDQEPLSKIYRIESKPGRPDRVKALDTTINSNYRHNGNICFSEDNKYMVVSHCSALNASDFTCELYLSPFLNNKWQLAVRMDDSINRVGSSSTQPCFARLNGRTALFFSSNRSGGEGGMDIWYAFQNEDGSFSQVINAGKNVNTADDEITPWFTSNDQVLYFSSTYHKGFGGFDIFKSECINGEFAHVKNAGLPINSSYNDLYFSMNAEATKAYLSSNRTGSTFEKQLNCCNDIYSFTIEKEKPPVELIDTVKLIKEKLKLLVPLTLYFHNDEPDPKTENTITTKNYENTYVDYKALYPIYNAEFIKGFKGSMKEKANYSIESFFTDSLEGGFDELKKFTQLLKGLMQKGVTVKITLKGFCSPLASTNYNKKLARRRICSVRNYFNETEAGFFTKFIEGTSETKGRLHFEEEDIGELPSSRVSDDFKDKSNSVYSPYAASERKIQIIAVSFE